jgi:hypothetical protein
MTSLYINRAHSSTNAKQVKDVLNEAFQEDIVKTVDVLQKTDKYTGEKFNSYFIHFKKTNAVYEGFVKRLSGKGAPIIYDDKDHYWMVSKFVKKTGSNEKTWSNEKTGSNEKNAAKNLQKMGGGLPSTVKYQGGHIETWTKAKA